MESRQNNLYDERGKRQGSYASGRFFNEIGCQLDTIARRFLQSEDLVKLLVNTEKDYEREPVTQKRIQDMLETNIRTIPVIKKDEDLYNYIIIQFGGFVKGERTDNVGYLLIFDIICNVENWSLLDPTPRPYKIMANIHDLIHGTKMKGLGSVEFVGANNLVINEELMGFTMTYSCMGNS